VHRIGHDSRAVGEPAADEFDDGKAHIKKERHCY